MDVDIDPETAKALGFPKPAYTVGGHFSWVDRFAGDHRVIDAG
jgi:hypothetical protein